MIIIIYKLQKINKTLGFWGSWDAYTSHITYVSSAAASFVPSAFPGLCPFELVVISVVVVDCLAFGVALPLSLPSLPSQLAVGESLTVVCDVDFFSSNSNAFFESASCAGHSK